MARGFGGLQRLLARRASPAPSDPPAVAYDSIDMDGAELGPPPVLRPAAIFRQVLYDPTEHAPAWLTRRPTLPPMFAAGGASAPSPTVDGAAAALVADVRASDAPTPVKRARRPKATTSRPAESAAPTRPRSTRVRKSAPGAAES